MSLKLSQAQTVLAVAVGLLLAADVYLGLSYLSAQDQKLRLEGQYRSLEQSLARLVGPSRSEDALVSAGPAFPKDPPGIQLTDLVIRTAQETGTEILGMHSSAVVTEQIGSGTYRAMKINIRLRGEPRRLAAFFDRLERGAVPTMVFDNIDVATISDVAASPGADATRSAAGGTRAGEAWDVSLDLLAYSQGG